MSKIKTRKIEEITIRFGLLVCIFFVICIFVTIVSTQQAEALSAYEDLFERQYGYSTDCAACHIRGGGSQSTTFGRDFQKAGASLETFQRIAQDDSDGDGFSNLVEIKSRSNPGDSQSTPKNPGDWLSGVEQEEPAGEFSLDTESPQEEKASKGKGLSLGPITNINFGGLLDLRYMIADTDAGNVVIHVNELVISANVTDNISLLVEQLLPTSELISLVGDDHGFAAAIISNIPLLPVGTALKIGRYRFKYGVDARLDAPANPMYPLVRKNLGFISDLGIEISGFFGPVSYYASVLNGPDHLETPLNNAEDEREAEEDMNQAPGIIIVPIRNNSKPVAIRLSTELPGSFELGLSYFEGNSWPYMNGMHAVGAHTPGGVIDRSRLLFKRRYTADMSYRLWKLDLLGEANLGKDHVDNTRLDIHGYYGRVDYNVLPRKLILSGQYDFWDDGLKTGDEHTFSGCVTYYISNQVFIRGVYAYQKLKDNPRPNIATVQLYLPY